MFADARLGGGEGGSRIAAVTTCFYGALSRSGSVVTPHRYPHFFSLQTGMDAARGTIAPVYLGYLSSALYTARFHA